MGGSEMSSEAIIDALRAKMMAELLKKDRLTRRMLRDCVENALEAIDNVCPIGMATEDKFMDITNGPSLPPLGLSAETICPLIFATKKVSLVTTIVQDELLSSRFDNPPNMRPSLWWKLMADYINARDEAKMKLALSFLMGRLGNDGRKDLVGMVERLRKDGCFPYIVVLIGVTSTKSGGAVMVLPLPHPMEVRWANLAGSVGH
jgi:hypothetical protein